MDIRNNSWYRASQAVLYPVRVHTNVLFLCEGRWSYIVGKVMHWNFDFLFLFRSFISKIPRVPSLVVAVNDTIQTDMSVNLTKKGNIMAGNNGLLFITTNDFHNQCEQFFYSLLLRWVINNLCEQAIDIKIKLLQIFLRPMTWPHNMSGGGTW